MAVNTTLSEYTNSTPPEFTFQDFLWGANLYFQPVLITFGFVGNLLSLLVFLCSGVRRLSSSVYLAALAVSDTGFLVQLFLSWLAYVKVFVFHSEGWCQTGVYLSYVCGFLSIWFVVSFTVERYIAVCHPLKRQEMCTRGRAQRVVIGLSVFGTVAYSYGAWTSGINPENGACQPLDKFEPMLEVFTNIDTVVTLIIPSVAIIAMNVRIVFKIAYFYDRRASMVNDGSRESVRPGNYGAERPEAPRTLRNRSQIKITKMLLIVSTSFLLLNLPSHAIRIYHFLMKAIDSDYMPKNMSLHQWQEVANLVYYCNFAINFLLYSICGRNFRKECCRLINRCRKSKKGLPNCLKKDVPFNDEVNGFQVVAGQRNISFRRTVLTADGVSHF